MSMTWTETSSIEFEHPAFRVPSRTPISSCRLAKSASMKLKLGIIIDVMLLKKQIKKVIPCLWCGLRCLKFGTRLCVLMLLHAIKHVEKIMHVISIFFEMLGPLKIVFAHGGLKENSKYRNYVMWLRHNS